MKPSNITFILVRPRYAGNIGSTARALRNMGFSKLSLVLPAALPSHPEARRLAVGAAPLLKKAKVFDSLEEAVKGIHYLIGTSRRTGKHRQDFVTLPDLATKIPVGRKIGILFGPEERGLSNSDLALCHLVTMIPSNPEFPSLNLAQSVMVVAYQLQIAQREGAGEDRPEEIPLAPLDKVEAMYQHLEKMLREIKFFANDNSFHMMRAIRQIFGRTGLTEREVRILRGISRQVLWMVTQEKM